MLKRFISIIVLIVLASSVFASNIKLARCTTLISQDFDGEATGSTPQGWTLEDPSLCSLTVNDSVYYGSAGKSARYADLASFPMGAAHVVRTFEDQHGSVVISFAMMTENPDYLMLYIDDEMARGANIYFMPDNWLAYYDGSGWNYLRPFTIDMWYQIKMVIDVPTNTYDIYVDNPLEMKGAHFRGFGQTNYLNKIEFGINSYEMPVGFIDDVSILAEERVTPPTTIVTLTGGLDYLQQEDVKVRLDALVKDSKTMSVVSNATVAVEIYCPNGSVWVSDTMLEKTTGSGIYEWESSGTN